MTEYIKHTHIGFTLLYFKMAVIPLVPETKMVDVDKLISFGKLSVWKVTWFVLTTTSTPLILFRVFGTDHMTWLTSIYTRLSGTLSLFLSLSPILTYRDSTHSLSHILTSKDGTLSVSLCLSLSLSLFISTTRISLTLPVSKTQLNTCIMGAYTFCNLFLSGYAFSVRLVPGPKTASEISSNPERDKQPTWKKTRFSKNTLLYFCILIPRMKYLVNIHFIVYWTLLIFCLSPL